MSTTDLLMYSLGSIGIFTSRGFLPAFITALSMRYGNDIPLIQNIDLFQTASQTPTWFTHDITLVALGLLSGLEVTGDKIPEVREMMSKLMSYSRPAMAVLTNIGVMSTTDVAIANDMIQHAGFGNLMQATVAGVAVFYTSSTYQSVKDLFIEADPGDELGLQGLISWFDDFWAIAGIILIIVFPILIVLISIFIFYVISRVARRIKEKEQKLKIKCPSCQTDVFRSACQCPNCKNKFEAPHALNWLGQSTEETTSDLKAHATNLLIKGRCPSCATHLKNRVSKQSCEECGHSVFEEEDVNRFLGVISARLPMVLIVSGLLSLIPVVGLIPGIILYRLALIVPFRRYIPMHKSLMVKWGLRLFFFVLIAVQWIPAVGGVVLPLMAFISYSAYRKSFVNSLGE